MAEHLDAHELTDLALRADARSTARQRAHLQGCSQCRDELAQLRRTVRAARDVSTDDFLTAPPDLVWHSVAADLERHTDPAAARTESDGGGPGPRRLRPHGRARLHLPATLLAAVGLTVGIVVGGAIGWRLDDGPHRVAMSEVSRLAPLSVPEAVGTMRLVRGPGAGREVTLTVENLPRMEGYYEVWFMDRTRTRLIAMGVLGPEGSARLPLPEGIDLSGYPLVDVSAQENNGNPKHSGVSVVRGSLPE